MAAAAKKVSAKAPAPQAPAAPPAKKGAAPTTVTWKQITESMAEQHGLTKQAAKTMFDGLIDQLTGHLKQGERVRINGLGILQVKRREARTGRNPATGAPIEIPASKKVTLTVAKELKEAV